MLLDMAIGLCLSLSQPLTCGLPPPDLSECVCPSPGDVFLLQTRDRKNPLVYTVFSTSRSESIDIVSVCVHVHVF